METIKKFIIGSRCFFENFDDFNPSDTDELHIMDKRLFGKKGSYIVKSKNEHKDYILYPPCSKDEFIEYDLNVKDPMKLGKYICPEFIEYIDLTINDLKKFDKLFDKVDDRHKYQKIIYDSYIQNNSFSMTDDQLRLAYEEYKKYRKT